MTAYTSVPGQSIPLRVVDLSVRNDPAGFRSLVRDGSVKLSSRGVWVCVPPLVASTNDPLPLLRAPKRLAAAPSPLKKQKVNKARGNSLVGTR